MDYEKDAHGIRYVGDIYEFPLENGDKKELFIKSLIFAVLYLLLIILAGLVNNAGSRKLYIAVPYAFLFFPYAYLTMGTFSIRMLSPQMEKVCYDRSIGRMFRSCAGLLGLSFYLIVADIICLLLSGGEETLHAKAEAVFLCACIAVFAIASVQICGLHKCKKKVMILKHNEEVPIGK